MGWIILKVIGVILFIALASVSLAIRFRLMRMPIFFEDNFSGSCSEINLRRMRECNYIKASAVLVELFQYWVVGMLIAASLVVFVPWAKIRKRMGYGGLGSNFVACTAGAVIPICSCGIVPVLAGMIEAGIPLGPTMAFLIAAPMWAAVWSRLLWMTAKADKNFTA